MTRFQDYFLELTQKFNEYHINLVIETTEEDIHKIRTTLKKLRTFNILLDGLLFRDKDFPIELRNLFKTSGEIRDIQIQLNILKEYNDEYKDDYQKELQYLNDKLDKVEDYHIDEQIIANIKARIEVNLDDTRNMISNVSSENLHEIRTKIKRSYYTRLMLGITDNIELLDEIQETIGNWHDLDVTIENINNFDKRSKIIDSLKQKREEFYKKSLELITKL